MRRGGTYVSGLTSTAFIWSVARRRKTHELGWMPLPDTILLWVSSVIIGGIVMFATKHATEKLSSYVGLQKVLSHASRQHGPNLNLTSPIAQKII
jgi:hypothetical protein